MFLKMAKRWKLLGGGNCQVSSTLYNAVLKVPNLKVTERHEHSNSVPYVKKGKDAAVASGSYDFKFVNNTGNKIKITASCDKNNVYIKSIFAGLRPIVVGLIASAALILMNKENFPDYTLSILICIGAFCLVHYTKLHPIWIIVLAGVTGFLVY